MAWKRIPSTLGEPEIVEAPDYLAVLTEGGRALPFGITGISIDFGTIAAPLTWLGIDGGTIASPSRLPLDFGSV
jgi:hypothetical protein